MKSPNDLLTSSHDPVRWADMSPETLGPASKLLVSPAPIKALPSDVAMRVRSNVLRSPAPSVVPAQSGSILTRNAAALKLGGIAVGAALFGAGAMTALSSAQDSSGLRVLVAPTSIAADGASARPLVVAHNATNRASLPESARPRAEQPDSANDGLGGIVSPADRAAEHPSNTSASRGTTATTDERGKGLVARDDEGRAPLDSHAERHAVSALGERSARVSAGDEDSVQDAEAVAAREAKEGSFELLTQAEAIDRPVVRPQFRRVTTARKAASRTELSSLEEETRLLEEARSKLGRAPDAALRLALDHQSRFRQGQLLEQRRMIHLEALLRLGRDDEAKKLASTIGSSIYQARANALLVRYGIVVE